MSTPLTIATACIALFTLPRFSAHAADNAKPLLKQLPRFTAADLPAMAPEEQAVGPLLAKHPLDQVFFNSRIRRADGLFQSNYARYLGLFPDIQFFLKNFKMEILLFELQLWTVRQMRHSRLFLLGD